MNMHRIAQVTYALLRVVAGLLMFQAGSMKMFGWFGGMPGGGTASLTSQVGIGGAIEVIGGALVMLGLFTRPAAFILSGQMAVAYWQFHAPKGAWPILNHGELAAVFSFLYLYFAARGGGDYSLDALRSRSRGITPKGLR